MSKKNFINSTHIEGYVYEHNLEIKVAGERAKNPGVEFINGTLSIATDDDMLNVIQVHYSYVTEITSKNKPNATYGVLKDIIDGKIGSVIEHGKENAGKVRIDSAIALNEWYDMRNNGDLISTKRNEGGFIHIVIGELSDPKTRATFNTDFLITNTRRIEADEEKEIPEKLIVSGYIFDFRKAILPVDFTVLAPRAMDYFEGLTATSKEPVFTRVQGQQISQTIVRKISEESAFGDAAVREVRSSRKEFVVNWAQATPYDFDTEDTITAEELTKAKAEREIYLADVKKRNEEYAASSSSSLGNIGNAIKNDNDYDF